MKKKKKGAVLEVGPFMGLVVILVIFAASVDHECQHPVKAKTFYSIFSNIDREHYGYLLSGTMQDCKLPGGLPISACVYGLRRASQLA